MNICIPIDKDLGAESPICAHFGSAPGFLLIDTESGAMRAKRNDKQEHEHGQCRPLDAIAGESVETMIVGGIGRGAFMGLSAAGIRVLISRHGTVKEALRALEEGELGAVEPSSLCAGHDPEHEHGSGQGQRGGGCGHGRGGAPGPF